MQNFKIKVKDIKKFLMQQNYIWKGYAFRNDDVKNYPNGEVTDSNLYDFENENVLIMHTTAKMIGGIYRKLEMQISPFEFLLTENYFNYCQQTINLTNNWIKYLISNRRGYAYLLKKYCETKKQEVNSFDGLENVKKQLDHINNIESILKQLETEKEF